jgi:hypothetical protein
LTRAALLASGVFAAATLEDDFSAVITLLDLAIQ